MKARCWLSSKPSCSTTNIIAIYFLRVISRVIRSLKPKNGMNIHFPFFFKESIKRKIYIFKNFLIYTSFKKNSEYPESIEKNNKNNTLKPSKRGWCWLMQHLASNLVVGKFIIKMSNHIPDTTWFQRLHSHLHLRLWSSIPAQRE